MAGPGFGAAANTNAGIAVPMGGNPASLADGGSWNLDGADVRLLEAGWRFDAKKDVWKAELILRFVDRDPLRDFHKTVLVEFQEGAKRWTWKTLVSLGAGMAQNRTIEAPGLSCPGPVVLCPEWTVRVTSKKRSDGGGFVPIARKALDDPDAPQAGVPLWIASVSDATILKFSDGRCVRLLGVKVKELHAREAANWVRARIWDAPTVLTYDGLPQDVKGCWRAYAGDANFPDFGAELIRRRWAVPDGQVAYSRKNDYLALEGTKP